MSPTPPALPALAHPRRIALDVLMMLLINSVAGLLWLLVAARPQTGLGEAMLYSHVIGFCCYASSLLAKRVRSERRSQLALTVLLLPLAVLLGLALAGALHGDGALNVLQWTYQHRLVVVGFSLAAALSGFAIMWSRDVVARRHAELEARAARAEAAQGEAARAQAAAELAALQAQIEPHFLFNTLANMRSLITRDPVLAQQLLDRLITYLRSSLQGARAVHTTLGEEFALLDSYLDIQRIRMGGRLSYQLDLPAALGAQPCVPMLLQPLVENALRHGLEPQLGPVHVRLAASVVAGRLCLEVQDNGVGFGVAASGGSGLGLSNLKSRLASAYGEQAQLLIESPPEGGVRVRIELPEAAL